MPVEIEAKVRVDDHEPVRRRLRAAGAVPDGEVLETNTFFDSPERTLLAGDRGLRTRTAVDTVTGASHHTLTFKGPRQKGEFKTREELETTLGDAAVLEAILPKLGYTITLSFEKRRQSWTLGDCRIELDTLPLLGTFVEAEGPDADTVRLTLTAIGLQDEPRISDSYIAMLMAKLDSEVAYTRILRFAPDAK